MSVELKVKSKHLAEEARIIRFEENKFLKRWKYDCKKHAETGNSSCLISYDNSNYRQYNKLREHRVEDVRNENRATFLARAYIAGNAYSTVEQKRKTGREYHFYKLVVPRIVSMVAKYGNKQIPKEIWSGPFGARQKVKNPEYIQLESDIKQWLDC